MHLSRFALLTTLLAGAGLQDARAAQIQWATGCVSYARPQEVLAVSYETQMRQVTLYRTDLSSRFLGTDKFTAPIESITKFEVVNFTGHSGNVLPVEFGTKNSMYLGEEGNRISYYCHYYSFDQE